MSPGRDDPALSWTPPASADTVDELREAVTDLEKAVAGLQKARRQQSRVNGTLRDGLRGVARVSSGRTDLDHDLVAVVVGADDERRWMTFGTDRRFFLQRRLGEIGLASYELGTMATLLALLDEPDAALADIGANIGLVSLIVAGHRPDVPVTAFEPTPDLAAMCRELAERNGLSITVEELALGDEDGTTTLHLSGTDTSNSLQEGFREAVGEIDVDVRRFDSWVDGAATPPTVVKIDTETTEPAVLAGASGYIAAARPWLVVEVLRGRTEDELERWCRDNDYATHILLPDGPAARDEVEGDPDHEHLNWLFAPRPLPDDFDARFDRWRDRLASAATIDLRG